jgi:hypothetical protein
MQGVWVEMLGTSGLFYGLRKRGNAMLYFNANNQPVMAGFNH